LPAPAPMMSTRELLLFATPKWGSDLERATP
jgi:hypothetical protein